MTKFVATIDCRNDASLRDTLSASLGEALAELGTITRREPSASKAHALDPATVQILVAVSGSQVLAALIKGLMDYLVQKAKKGTIKLTVGTATIELASDTSPEQIKAHVQEVEHALRPSA